jgi:hypothetical protein
MLSVKLLERTLRWETSKGTEMTAILTYAAWFDNPREWVNAETPTFIEMLSVELYAGDTLLGSMQDETIDGHAIVPLFEFEGKTQCMVDDEGELRLIMFDGLNHAELEKTWDLMAQEFDPDIWKLRVERKAQMDNINPIVEIF